MQETFYILFYINKSSALYEKGFYTKQKKLWPHKNQFFDSPFFVPRVISIVVVVYKCLLAEHSIQFRSRSASNDKELLSVLNRSTNTFWVKALLRVKSTELLSVVFQAISTHFVFEVFECQQRVKLIIVRRRRRDAGHRINIWIQS